ncbi:hypothetical protein RND81_13G060500 [Saponaria officinalis]|uniref:Uncharacterized protein n=1 Tax=Saponaria officinalis TaxID=3572 RepID=A0AAW1GY15_SAPOF
MATSCPDKDKFFDAPEEMSSESDCASEDSEDMISQVRHAGNANALNNFQYDFWIGNPRSIDERRDDFSRKTGFVIERCQTAREGPDPDDTFSYASSETSNNLQEAVNEGNDLSCQIQFPNEGRGCDNDNLCHDGTPARVDEEAVCISAAIEEFRRTFDSSKMAPDMVTKEKGSAKVVMKEQQGKKSWLKRFSFKAATMLGKDKFNENKVYNCREVLGSRSQKVRVRSHKKWSKELSSLYRKQEFPAHNGPILAMKFSPDGQHLATGGEDGTLNVWEVIEDNRSPDFDLLSFSPASASLYFLVNGTPNLASFLKVKDEGSLLNKLKKSSDCVMVPRKCFRLLEKPVHEFHGHENDILDISWSKKGHLLSSSVDKTVRLWQVGCGECLKTFPHNDYVTCAQFNPMDDNYFISGSIDGIIRIWEVFSCQVVHWLDIKEIVTAICYQPDGKGGIVGSMAGSCSFFNITDDSLRHHQVLSLQGKRTLTCKQITGFQFSPADPREVVVSSADSLVRVLRGADVICKLRGSLPLIDRKCQIYASFTSDGKHVISAAEESNVYVWNHLENERNAKWEQGKTKTIWSCESFLSDNALIAVPWHGFTPTPETPSQHSHSDDDDVDQKTPLLARDLGCMKNESSFGSSSRSSAAVPDEETTKSSPSVVLPAVGNIDCEFLRNVCESILSGSHLWGLVIVTGGKDGKIQAYQNYGLPVGYPKPKSLKSSFSFSSFRKRCPENCSKSASSSSRDSLQSL